MNRLRALVALAVVLVGCATSPSPPPAPVHHAALGVTISPSYTEALTLGNATVTTAARYTGLISFVSYSVVSTGTASGAWTIEYSNDNTTWDTYTLTTSPPAAAGSGQTFGVGLDLYEPAYVRLKFTGSGGTGAATVVTQMKGG